MARPPVGRRWRLLASGAGTPLGAPNSGPRGESLPVWAITSGAPERLGCVVLAVPTGRGRLVPPIRLTPTRHRPATGARGRSWFRGELSDLNRSWLADDCMFGFLRRRRSATAIAAAELGL
jgi:hypothetical protein